MSAERPLRSLLMLAAGYPPDEQYILRTAKFAAYLPEFGWKPVVLTPRFRQRPTLADPSFTAERHRTLALPAPSQMLAALRRAASAKNGDAATPEDGPSPAPIGVVSRWLRRALLWIETPDPLAGWLPFAVASGWRLVRKRRIAAIHASGPPFSVVLAGAILARLTQVPLVADFRDAWTLDASDPIGMLGGAFRAVTSPRRLALLQRLERGVLRASAATLFTSAGALDEYRRHYPDLADRFVLVENGADEADFAGALGASEAPTVAHIGTLHEFQADQIAVFLATVGAMRRAGELPPGARFVFLGPIGRVLRQRVEAMSRAAGTQDLVQVLNEVSHVEAVVWMRRSWLLLLFIGDNRVLRLSKLSEYRAAGRPILAYGPAESPTGAEVLAAGGALVSGSDAGGGARALREALRARPAASAGPAFAHPHPLSRRTEASTLADLLSRLVEGG